MNGTKIVAMMQTAHEAGRAVPSIVFETEKGRVKLYRQTERSKAPGSISLNDGGSPDVWYGSIGAKNGTFNPTRACPTWVRQLVAEFAVDPGAFAAAYGKGSARCCFCATEITTDESKAVGYGPTCASNYGLPWGSKKAPTLKDWVADPSKVVRESKAPELDFESAFDGDPGNDAEAALAAMEGAAGYASPEQETAARSFKATPAETLADAILDAAKEGGREGAIKKAQMWIDIHAN